MSMEMERFANHVIAVAQENHNSITNLELQKVMYFVLKTAKEESIIPYQTLETIYDEPFKVWGYGPVVESQYNRFKGFCSSPIIGIFSKSPELECLNPVILDYLKENIFVLVRRSHKVPFWRVHISEIEGLRSDVSYSLEDI